MSYPQQAAPLQKKFKRSFWFNLLLVMGVCAVCYLLFFSTLSIITRHGDDVKVPPVIGKDVRQAMKLLEDQGFDVRVDSTYFPEKKAFLVLNQIPDVGDMVKHGRTLFLTVNRAVPPMTPMPNLISATFRSATMILKSNRLILGDTTYVPDIAEGAIKEQLYQGKPIRPGMMVPQGSRIDLVIGGGLSNEIDVPDVIGLTYPEAMAMLNSSGLGFTPVFDPDVTDTLTARIYKQTPNHISDIGATSVIRQGDFIDIKIGQNPADSVMEANRNEYKKFLFNNPPPQTPDNDTLR